MPTGQAKARIALATFGVVILSGCSASTAPPDASGSESASVGMKDALVPELNHDNPCVGAERARLPDAEGAARVTMPNTETVNQASLEQAWLCGTGSPLLQWAAISIHYEDGWGKIDEVKNFAGQIEQHGVGRVIDIGATPVLVTPSQEEGSPSVALLVVGGTMCEVLGYDVTEHELVDVARSLVRA